MKRYFFIAFVGALAVKPILAAPNIIRISGSSTVTPIASKAAEKFKKTHQGVRVFVSPTGSGAGIQALGSGTVDIGMVSRNIDPKEKAKFPKANFYLTPVGQDAVVPVVSAAVYKAGVTSLSLEELRKIYSGEVKNWNQVGGLDHEILVIDKESSRGTRHVFMQVVFGNKSAKALGARLVTGSNNEEQTAVAQSDSAIGMLSKAWMNEKVKGLAIKSGDNKIEPTVLNIRKGIYPISRNLNFVTNGKPEGLVKTFIDFVLSQEGQTIVEELEYVTVREPPRNIH